MNASRNSGNFSNIKFKKYSIKYRKYILKNFFNDKLNNYYSKAICNLALQLVYCNSYYYY